MKAADLKAVAEREPFHPFTVRLTNGAQYTFSHPRNFGAPKNYSVIFHFGNSQWVMVDRDTIAEVIRR